MRRIIQFGTKINEILRFPSINDDWEDSWSDELDISQLELQFADGSFRNLGFDRSRKKTKSITKRFTIDYTYLSDNERARYIDHINKVLRGGVKKLIAEREDKTLMWIYAECVSLNYSYSGESDRRKVSYVAEFVCHFPYWVSFHFGQVGFWSVNNISEYFNLCEYYSSIKYDYEPCRDLGGLCESCLELIIEDTGFAGASAELCKYGEFSTDYMFSSCITSSAGSIIEITFKNGWNNPKISWLNSYIQYNGSTSTDDILHLSTLNYNGNSKSLFVESNNTLLTNENIVSVINDSDIKSADVTYTITGSTSSSLVACNILSKYHN